MATLPNHEHAEWPVPAQPPVLGDSEIHLWSIRLMDEPSGGRDIVEEHMKLLSADEIFRAKQFLFDKHRRRFVFGRARQRMVMACYLGLPPQSIRFQYDGLGKPSLQGSQLGQGWRFNFTNSAEHALLAMTHNLELGVDLEKIRPMQNLQGLSERFFCGIETRQIMGLSGDERLAAFFRCWTRKEAYLKAVGKGLTYPLSKVQVSIAADQPAQIEEIDGDRLGAEAWSLRHLQPEPGYVGALAWSLGSVGPKSVRTFGWEDRLLPELRG